MCDVNKLSKAPGWQCERLVAKLLFLFQRHYLAARSSFNNVGVQRRHRNDDSVSTNSLFFARLPSVMAAVWHGIMSARKQARRGVAPFNVMRQLLLALAVKPERDWLTAVGQLSGNNNVGWRQYVGARCATSAIRNIKVNVLPSLLSAKYKLITLPSY